MYIHVQINVARLLIENDVVDINNEILTSITNNRLMVLKPDVYWWTHTCHLLLNWTGSIRHDLYVHTQSTDLYYWNQLYIDEHIHVLCYLSEPELVVLLNVTYYLTEIKVLETIYMYIHIKL